MRADIDKLWHELESKRIDLMLKLSRFDDTVLNKKPNADAWSINQVMQHLMVGELLSHQYLEKKLSFGVNVPKAGIKSRFRRLGLSMAFAFPFKYKAPQAIEPLAEFKEFNDLKIHWASQRLALHDFLSKMPDRVIDGEIWRHIIAGKMNIPQMLSFFNEHFDRHSKQIDRTIKIVELLD
jgi:DinB superfamily